MRGRVAILVLLLPLVAYAQHDSIYHKPDTTGAQENYRYYVDLTKKPDAIKAVWLPIVYGAFMGCGYAVSMMQNRYSGYKTAYLDLYNDNQAGTVSEDPSKSYIAVLPDGYSLSNVGGASTWMNTLKNRQNTYHRYRDYSILATVIVYALSLIDAYVDAQLFDYDISPDLTLNVEPQIYYDLQRQRSAELKVAIQF